MSSNGILIQTKYLVKTNTILFNKGLSYHYLISRAIAVMLQ